MRFLLLGERAAVQQDGSAAPSSPRTVSLVAYLAVHAGVPQPRATVAAALWPDTPGPQALTNLRRELHHLRRLFAGDGCLQVTATDLTWHDGPGCTVDLLDLRATVTGLRAAVEGARPAGAPEETLLALGRDLLGTYRGDLLPGLDDGWVVDLRAQVEQEFVDACDLLVGTATGLDPSSPVHGPALDAARRRVRLRPLEEAGHVTLMRLLAHVGDVPGALAAYHRCARVLRDELGVDPGAAAQALLAELLGRAGGASEDPPGRVVRPAGAGERDPLVGREPELAALVSQLDAATTSGLRVALVHGEAGSGKSRLVEELLAAARRRGLRTAAGGGHAMGGAVAMAPVLDWLAGEPGRPLPSGPGEGSARGAASWERLGFVRDLVRRLAASAPAVLVLEDVQWVDQDTLDLVSSLARWEPAARLLLVLTARSGALEESTDLARWTAGVRAQVPTLVVRTGPLTPSEGRTLVRRHGDERWDDDRCAALHAATGGFPLHLVEAARLLVRHERAGTLPAADLPTGDLRGVLTHRLTVLGGAAQQLAVVAAAVGRSASLPLLRLAGGLDDATTVQALDELCRAAVLVERPGGYDFTHDLLRDAAYELATPARRALVHLRVGEALERLHGEHLEDVAALLGEQYSRAGLPERAVRHLREAARAAGRVFAADRSIESLRAAALQLQALPAGPARDRDELDCLHDLAAVLNARHGWTSPALRSTLERAQELAAGLHDDPALADVLTGLWGTDYVRGANRQALATAEAARAAATRSGDRVRVAVGRFAVGATLVHLGRPRDGLDELEGAIAEGLTSFRLAVGSRPEVHARAWAAHARALLGDTEGATAASQEALDRAGKHPYDRALALAYAAVTAHLRDDRHGLVPLVDELAQQCGRYELGYYGSWGEALHGWIDGGEAGAARLRRAITDQRATGVGARSGYFLSLLADVTADPSEARAVLDAAAANARAQEDLWWLPEIERRRGLLRPAGERRPALEAALELATAQGSRLLAERCRLSLADLPEG
ncbi:ATP-binding protein [Ornithinimicrobium kibberense]|uniref:AAA family ATPase n=1 Tax=Ornithinimicrobium kibberense TaxID=282060 RepID=A0ABV5V3S7_9MICO|nr:AAA family ATPase [Ornithinimicrobium kibberense]